jgi:hypothetical protein
MHNCQKLSLLKKIIFLIVFLSVIPLTFIIFILGEISVLYSFFSNYVISGKSLFIPFLPNYNIFWFLPKEAQIFQISIGQLIDLFVIFGILSFLEIVGYQYYKKICLDEDFIEPILLESHQEIYQDQGIFFGLNEGSSISFKTKPPSKKYEKIHVRQGLSKNLFQNITNCYKIDILQKSFLLILSTKLKSRLHSFFEEFNNSKLFHYIFCPHIKTNVYLTNSFQYRGINMNYTANNVKNFNRLNINLNFIKYLISNNKIRYQKWIGIKK